MNKNVLVRIIALALALVTICPFIFSCKGSNNGDDTTTTTTTLIINKDSVDDRCEYFIDGNKGEEQPDGTVIFTGLTPNTKYTVEARASYTDNGETKYVYSFADDTTKPAYKATIRTYLDGVLTDISGIHGDDVELFLVEKTTNTHVDVEKTDVGTYTATVFNGVYYPWHHEAETMS